MYKWLRNSSWRSALCSIGIERHRRNGGKSKQKRKELQKQCGFIAAGKAMGDAGDQYQLIEIVDKNLFLIACLRYAFETLEYKHTKLTTYQYKQISDAYISRRIDTGSFNKSFGFLKDGPVVDDTVSIIICDTNIFNNTLKIFDINI